MTIARTVDAVERERERVYNLIENASLVKGFFGVYIKDG